MAKWIVLVMACLLMPDAMAQDGPTARAFCDLLDPGNNCPGPSCVCTEDVLGLRFQPSGNAVIELEDLGPDLRLDVLVVLETKTTSVQGWAYGVRHDGRALAIESATTEGTDVGVLFQNGFNATRSNDLVDCSADPNRCLGAQPGTGFISAIVLSLIQPVELPLGTNSLARATYRLEPAASDVAEGGILLEFTEELAIRNSPPVPITFTVAGRSTRPKTIVDGKVIFSLDGKDFRRGDPDGDGRISVADAVGLLLFLFLTGPSPNCLDSGDFDDDGRLDTTDPVLILRWLFLTGSAPAAPGPPPAPCGPDPAGLSASLGCDVYGVCG